jgi:hypothetical protein
MAEMLDKFEQDQYSRLVREVARITHGGINAEGYAELEKLFASTNWQGEAANLVTKLKKAIDDIRDGVSDHIKNGLDNIS